MEEKSRRRYGNELKALTSKKRHVAFSKCIGNNVISSLEDI
jgi:hypothetical protein